MNDNQHLALCRVPRLRNRQLQVYNRIKHFCDGIIIAIHSAINSTQHNQHQITIPSVISNEIIQYSNHYQIQQIWIGIFHKLKQFAYHIKDGCPINEIQTFENKYKTILNDNNFELPSDIRVSLMICNSIEIPRIFDQWNDDMYGLHGLECDIYPLAEWMHVSTEYRRSVWDLTQNFENELDHWLDSETAVEYNNIVCMGEGGGDRKSGLSWYLYFVNLKTGQTLDTRLVGDYYHCDYRFSSFEEFLRRHALNTDEMDSENMSQLYEQNILNTGTTNLTIEEIKEFIKDNVTERKFSHNYYDKDLTEVIANMFGIDIQTTPKKKTKKRKRKSNKKSTKKDKSPKKKKRKR